MSNEHLRSRRVSRRDMLQAAGLGGLGLLAAACGSSSGASSSHRPSGRAAGATRSTPPSFVISDDGIKLPTGDVSLHWMDSGDAKAYFFKAFFAALHKKYPNINVSYDGTNWNEIDQAVAIGLRNGSAPDVFQLPPQLPVAEAVSNGYLGAVDDIITNWSEVKRRFPVGTFANGVTDFDNKTYGMPFTSNKRIGNLLLYNVEQVKRADYDLGGGPISWDELRAVAKKCTKQGNGQYYGIIFGLTQEGGLSGPFSTLAQMSGLAGGFDAGDTVDAGIDWKTGQFNYTADLTLEAIELMLALKSDGSIFPGAASLDQPGIRERFPQGVASLILQGPWNVAIWQQSNPGFKFGVSLPPVKKPKAKLWPLTYGPGGSNTWYYNAKTKLSSVIGLIYSYLSTNAGQIEWADYDGGGDPPQFPAAFERESLGPVATKALQLGKTYTAIGPEPAVRNPDVEKVYEAYIPLETNCSDTLNGLFTGQITGKLPTVMKDLQDRTEKSLETAIATARKRGAKVERDDWVFPDWNPAEPYTKMYQK